MSKLLLLGCTPPPIGGIAKWTTRMIQTQLPDGWEIVLIDEKLIGRDVFGGNNRVNYLIEAKRWIKIWSNLVFKLCDKEIKVVHSCPIASRNSMLAENVNAFIARLFRKKIVLHFRCTVPNMIVSKKQERLLKKLCDKGDIIIALNSQTKLYLEKITETRIVVLPNFVDQAEIAYSCNKTKEKINTLIYVGGVTKEKGCLEIIELAKRFPDFTFKLVGEIGEDVREEASKFFNVVLTGVKSSEEVRKELTEADVFLFFSHYSGEGFSNALAEAMAAGKPCIVTDWAANADMIDHQKGGYVISCGDIDAAQKYLNAMRSSDIRASQSAYNKEKVKNKYSQDIVINEYVKIYNELIKRSN